MNATTWSAVLVLPVSSARDHIRGPMTAPVTLVEYGDYECSYCGAAHGTVNAIQTHVGNRLRFVFRHFPLTTVHPHARQAAEAAEAAGAQRKFWAMHETLFENQDKLSETWLIAYARTVGLNLEAFKRDLAQQVHAPKIREDFLSGVRSGVNGTPTFYINGVRHDGSWDFATLLGAITLHAELDEAHLTTRAG